MMKAVSTVIALVILSSVTQAQWMFMRQDGDTILREGVRAIYNVEFKKASEKFKQVIALYPEHPAGYFMDAMIDWWRILLNQRSTRYDQQFLSKIDRVLAKCDELLSAEPKNITALFFKGGALGFRGRYYAVRQQFVEAASVGKEGMEILRELQKIAPTNHDIMLGTGVYNYYAAALPERYPLLKPVMLFLPRGDKKLGILQLKAAGNQARYAAVEAKAQLMAILYNDEKKPSEAIVYARELTQQYPNNPYFARYLGRCLVQLGPLDSMEMVWRTLLLGYMDKKEGYDEFTAREALYYIGTVQMLKGNYDIALKYLYKCDEASRLVDKEMSGFMVKANLKIGQIYDVQGKRDLAISQYKKVAGWRDYDGTQDEAARYIAKPYGR